MSDLRNRVGDLLECLDGPDPREWVDLDTVRELARAYLALAAHPAASCPECGQDDGHADGCRLAPSGPEAARPALDANEAYVDFSKVSREELFRTPRAARTAPSESVGGPGVYEVFPESRPAPADDPHYGAHSLERTSPIGTKFIGKCRYCGIEGLTAKQANEPCPKGRPQEVAIIDAIVNGPAPAADDAEAVTEEWLRSQGVNVWGRNGTCAGYYIGRENPVCLYLVFDGSRPTSLSIEGRRDIPNPTRGTVRALCAALGLELPPPPTAAGDAKG